MTDEEFKKHVEALAGRRLEKAKRLRAQHIRYWAEIITQQYNFERGWKSRAQDWFLVGRGVGVPGVCDVNCWVMFVKVFSCMGSCFHPNV